MRLFNEVGKTIQRWSKFRNVDFGKPFQKVSFKLLKMCIYTFGIKQLRVNQGVSTLDCLFKETSKITKSYRFQRGPTPPPPSSSLSFFPY